MLMQARPEEQGAVVSVIPIPEDYKNFPLGQLQNVKVVGIGGSKSELDFINYLLLASPVLEKMTVKPASAGGAGWDLAKKLLRFRRASMLAEVIYLDP